MCKSRVSISVGAFNCFDTRLAHTSLSIVCQWLLVHDSYRECGSFDYRSLNKHHRALHIISQNTVIILCV